MQSDAQKLMITKEKDLRKIVRAKKQCVRPARRFMQNDTVILHQFRVEYANSAESFLFLERPFELGCSIKRRGNVTWIEISNGSKMMWAVLEKGEYEKLLDKHPES
jgi:hypothetical protein